MIINFYISDHESRLIDQLKLISEEQKRSLSYLIREALESYLDDSAKLKKLKKEDRR